MTIFWNIKSTTTHLLCVVFLNWIQTSLLYVHSFVIFFTLFQPIESSTFQHTPSVVQWFYWMFNSLKLTFEEIHKHEENYELNVKVSQGGSWGKSGH